MLCARIVVLMEWRNSISHFRSFIGVRLFERQLLTQETIGYNAANTQNVTHKSRDNYSSGNTVGVGSLKVQT